MSDTEPQNDTRGHITRFLSELGEEPLEGLWGQRVELEFDLEQATGGRYSYVDEIGAGGMGRVVLAHDRELDRDVAVKILEFPGAHHSDPAVIKFLHEAKITAGLTHPGIVPVHDLGCTADGQHYFIMRVVEGTTLRELLDDAVKPGVDRVARVSHLLGLMVRVCEAVGYAHHKGILHLDLKPKNIMEGPFGEVLVMDWGVAKSMTEIRATEIRSAHAVHAPSGDTPTADLKGDILGTPGFMAPEQYTGEAAGLCTATDVFALGVILYEILAGRKPFRGATFGEVQMQVMAGRFLPVHLAARRAGYRRVPRELAAICEKALAVAAEERYPDARDMGHDIAAYIENRAVSAFSGNWYWGCRRWAHRHRFTSATLITVAVWLAVAIFAGLVHVASQRQYIAVLQQQVASRREDYHEATRQADWLKRQLSRTSPSDVQKRKELGANLRRVYTRKHLTAQQLRSALAALFAAQRDNANPALTREMRTLWLEEMALAIREGDVAYVRQSFQRMQEERGSVPWWNWEPDEFDGVERLRNWLKQNEGDVIWEFSDGVTPDGIPDGGRGGRLGPGLEEDQQPW